MYVVSFPGCCLQLVQSVVLVSLDSLPFVASCLKQLTPKTKVEDYNMHCILHAVVISCTLACSIVCSCVQCVYILNYCCACDCDSL